jgi:hypothetical protein
MWLKKDTPPRTDTQLLHRLSMQVMKIEKQLTTFQNAAPHFTPGDEENISKYSNYDELNKELNAVLDARFLKMEEKLSNIFTGAEQSVSQHVNKPKNKYSEDERNIAKSNALSIIDNAIENGRWTEKDSMNLIQYSHKLNHDEYLELLEKYGSAVNENKLTFNEPFLF